MSKYKFDAEIGKVLKIVINSIYTHKEIFLRELISNASDAISKLKYESLSNSKLIHDGCTPKISVELKKDERKIVVSDNGIGMNKEDMIQNLGTIAKSGTEAFAKVLQDGGNSAELIGQFGVGFYSAFMVASKVEVLSKKAGTDEACLWVSEGEGDYTIDDAKKDSIGTEIILYIKDGEEFDEYLDKFRVEHVIKSYSSHIQTPIELIYDEGSSLIHNESSAIWLKNPSEVSEEEYKTAYNAIGGMPSGYFAKIHSKVEGTLEYSALLFIPQIKPYDIYNPARKNSIKLYVKRVFITEENTAILPEHFRFIKGVVDSSDLPLNISRETLQNNRVLEKIGKSLEKKIIGEFESKLKNDRDEYTKFWADFGNVIKEGLCKPGDLNLKLLDACIFRSTNGTDFTTIEEYISRMKPEQDSIYYITAESYEDGFNNPQLELCKKNGIEVLILTDTVDNFWVNVITRFKEKHFKPVSSVDLKIENNTEEAEIIDDEKNKKLIEKFKEVLGDDIGEVKISKKLVESPVCLSQGEGGMSIRMERYLFEQKQLPFMSPKILEINPNHKILEDIYSKIQKNEDASNAIYNLFDIACIEAGDVLRKPSNFAKRIVEMMSK
jgi:molecular chaperone HtpG